MLMMMMCCMFLFGVGIYAGAEEWHRDKEGAFDDYF